MSSPVIPEPAKTVIDILVQFKKMQGIPVTRLSHLTGEIENSARLTTKTFDDLRAANIIVRHQVAPEKWQWFIRSRLISSKIEDLLRQNKISFPLPAWQKRFLSWISETGDLPICHPSASVNPPEVFYRWFSKAAHLANHPPISLLIADFSTFFTHLAPMLVLSVYLSTGNPVRDIALYRRFTPLAKGPESEFDPMASAATRFTMAAKAKPCSNSIRATVEVDMFRALANKIEHAFNYIKKNKDSSIGPPSDLRQMAPIDQWMLHQLNKSIQQVTEFLERYRIDRAVRYLHRFFRHQYCRWYLEFARESRSNQQTRETIQYTLIQILAMFQLFSPDPCLRILDQLNTTGQILPFPAFDSRLVFTESFREVEWLKQLITLCRKTRGLFQIPVTQKLVIRMASDSPLERDRIKRHMEVIVRLGFFSHGEILERLDTTFRGFRSHTDTLQIIIDFRQEEERRSVLGRLIRQQNLLKRKMDRREKILEEAGTTNALSLKQSAALKKEYQKWITRTRVLEQAINDLR